MVRSFLILSFSLSSLGCLDVVDPSQFEVEADTGSGGGSAGGGGGGGGGGGASDAGCANDSSCGAGKVCVPCEGATHCVTGCRNDLACAADELCAAVACLTCPCPDGVCVKSPCVDKDKDGVVLSCDKSLSCPGKGKCDCNDLDATVSPTAKEACGNGKDDDCDALVDTADPDCQACTLPNPACTTVWDCNIGTDTCGAGCCNKCPPSQGACPPSMVSVASGIDPSTGCNNPERCVSPCICPDVVAPVCATNGSTYENSCQAQCAQATVLHQGACLKGEGLACKNIGKTTDCGPSGTMYCRDACPQCGGLIYRCTQVGVCVYDWDCPAGQNPPKCADGGVPAAKCGALKTCEYGC